MKIVYADKASFTANHANNTQLPARNSMKYIAYWQEDSDVWKYESFLCYNTDTCNLHK